MLRIWGGGLYESDDFYELCDEQGHPRLAGVHLRLRQVPHDRRGVPGRCEARGHATRCAGWRTIPSLVVWCGNNEMEMGATSTGATTRAWPTPTTRSSTSSCRDPQGRGRPHALLPAKLALLAPTTTTPPSDIVGDQHPWTVGFCRHRLPQVPPDDLPLPQRRRHPRAHRPADGAGVPAAEGSSTLAVLRVGGPRQPDRLAGRAQP